MTERIFRQITTPDVPKTEVGDTVQDAVDSDAIKVEATPNPDGTWAVVVTFKHNPLEQ